MIKKKFIPMAASLLLLFSVVGTSDVFVFNFTPGQPQQYAMDIKMNMNTDMNIGGQSLKMVMSFQLRYKIKLIFTGQVTQGIFSLKLEPSDVEGDWDIKGPTEHVVLKLRGGEMTGTQNGKVTIDTAKSIGNEEAKEFKNEIMALYLSGFMDIDRFGRMKQFRGDQSFVDFWKQQQETQIGFFGIVFPDRPLPVNAKWEETLFLKKLGQVVLDGEGIRCMSAFTRQADEVSRGRKISVFSFSSPFSGKNQTGFMDQAGQRIRVNMPSFIRIATGKIRFDKGKGILIAALAIVGVDASMNAMLQGQSVNINLQVSNITKVSLITK